VVQGKLKVAQWTRKLGELEVGVTSVDIEATSVGHDLQWGTTSFTKVSRASFATGDDRMDDPAVQQARAELEGYGPASADEAPYDVVDPVTGEIHRFGGRDDGAGEDADGAPTADVTPLRAGV
jgi:single-strand DNA-binding protein